MMNPSIPKKPNPPGQPNQENGSNQPSYPHHPDLNLQKVKNKKYYIKIPGLKVPVVLSEVLFKRWTKKQPR